MSQTDYVSIIIGAIVIIANIAYYYITGHKQKLRDAVIRLVIQAEGKFGSGTGNLKYDYVVSRANNFIPKQLKPFISDKLIDQFINDGLYLIKDVLDDGILNNSYKK